MKDNFSIQSEQYAKFRPGYPAELFQFLVSKVKSPTNVWDVGTGNGQFAVKLSACFKNVFATDISEQQLSHAEKKENIHYSKQAAEQTNFPNDFFDLVTVAQAIHWFDLENFYDEVDRVLRSGGILAIAGYSVFSSTPQVDKVVDHFYKNITGPYWDKERKYLDEHYQTIPVPTYDEIPCPSFTSIYEWDYEQLVGYLSTWSAVQHYIKTNGNTPLDLIAEDLKTAFAGKEKIEIRFPIHFRMFRK